MAAAYSGDLGENAVLSKGRHAAARAVGIAVVFADVHHQPRIEGAPVQTIRNAELDPIRMLARDGVASRQDLRLNSARHMHEIHAATSRIRWRRESFRSEERRVGKECRYGWAEEHVKKNRY